jgi:ABC-2 family transporter protein
MLDKYIDRIGDWNPQLFRELKSRLTGNAVIITVAGSIITQVIESLFFFNNNPLSSQADRSFHFLNWFLPTILMLGGVYTIVSDFDREEQCGTLNFIRLTPQSAHSIFLGKLIGVPSLIYLAILLALPLHLFVGISAGTSSIAILAWYWTIGVAAYLCLSVAILYSLHSHKHPILLTLLLSLPVNTFLGVYNYCSDLFITKREVIAANNSPLLSWFYLPIERNIFLFDGLIVLTFLLISYWLWVTIDRKYINPNSTSFKKEHSYWMNIQSQIWLLGFAMPMVTQAYSQFDNNSFDLSARYHTLAIFYNISAVGIYCIIPLIIPNKSSTQDWSQHRREHVTHEHRQWWQRGIVRDLIWDDRSPIGLAMLVNLLISAIAWGLSLIVFIHEDPERLIKSICGIIIVSILTLIHTVIINFIYLRSKAKNTGAIPIIILMSVVPLCLGLMSIMALNYWLSFHANYWLSLQLLSFSPLYWMGVMELSILNIGMIIMGQIGILARVVKLLQMRVREIGKIEYLGRQPTKHLLVRSNI